ncbi:MAG: UDP-N-acetylglucosamine pyrophosphorylase [Clostridia bacterium]|nr:UDP-N-acetylglucosamine pyrophosphorylase [Clostridia bacterium]
MRNCIKICELFDLSHTAARPLLEKYEYPWQALAEIRPFVAALCEALKNDENYDFPAPDVAIHKTAKVHPSANIAGPCVVGAGTEVRPCAFLRGDVLIGENCVIGNSCEFKNAVIFDDCQVPHFNYVGDSILGYHAHMGAGAVTSNVKGDRSNVVIKDGEREYETGRYKVGAFLGDYAEIGCNSVLNPGAVVGRGARVYPLSMVRGVVPEQTIYKRLGDVVVKY